MPDEDFQPEVKLTPEQKDCVDFRADGAMRVQGIAGSGKTTVLLARAEKLLQQPGSRVVMLTYGRILARYGRALARKAGVKGELTVSHLHEWMSRLLETTGSKAGTVLGDERREIIRTARNFVRKPVKPSWKTMMPRFHADDKRDDWLEVDFLAAEFGWIKGELITTLDQYMKAERTGRGRQPHLTADHRRQIWDILEMYNRLVRKQRARDIDDVATHLIERAALVPVQERPHHILIDEAQDLSRAQFIAIARLMPTSLTLAADKGQSIFRRNFSFMSLGIDVRGHRSKQLRTSHRTTKQIARLANSLQQSDRRLMKDDEFLPGVEPERTGDQPELWTSSNLADELTLIGRLAQEAANRQVGDPGRERLPIVGIMVPTNDRVEQISAELDRLKLPWVNIKDEEADLLGPGIKLITYHSAKGLEFDHAICTGLKEGQLPMAMHDPGDDEEQHVAAQRKLLYVGMTRAKYKLSLSAVRTYSRFVAELDKWSYHIKN